MKNTLILDTEENPEMLAAFGDIGPGVRVKVGFVEGLLVEADGGTISIDVDTIGEVSRLGSEEPPQPEERSMIADVLDME